jgi:hypothetical protein
VSTLPSPTPEAPLGIEPVLGWRVWRLALNGDGQVRLRAAAHDQEWPPQEALPAHCLGRRGGHAAPERSCSCGFYAADSVKSFAEARVFSYGAGVVGAIAMWGTVIEHARGARSEFAYPARIRLACVECLKGQRFVDPAVVLEAGPLLRPVCKRHSIGQAGRRLDAAAVQAELLSTYAVDLLPKPKLPRTARIGALLPTALKPLEIAGLVVIGILRVVITIFMWFYALAIFLAILSVAIGVVSGLISAVTRDRVVPPTPSVQVHETALTPQRAAHRAVPHPVPVWQPPPPPAAPCGVGHGNWVELVACGDPQADLLGFAVQDRPHGRLHDCISARDSYSKGPNWWVCWIPLRGARVTPWPDSPNPFRAPAKIGGVF